jgi:hypothetical protein
VEYLSVLNAMLQRFGMHAGFTLRVANKTDISLGFAYFIQKDVRLQVSDDPDAAVYSTQYKTAEYHYAEGAHDGHAAVEVPNGDSTRRLPGPFYLNGGSYTSDLSVLSATLTQHF